MFNIKTFFEKHTHELASLNSLEYTRERYIGLKESSQLRDYFAHRKFTPEYMQLLVTVEYRGKVLIGTDGLNGLDLWEQTYFDAIEQYVETGYAETMYGVDPVILKLQAGYDRQLHFLITSDGEPEYIYVDTMLPEKEFLKALLTEAEHFWQVLQDYKVFEQKKMREDTPSDYAVQMIKKTKKLKDIVTLLK